MEDVEKVEGRSSINGYSDTSLTPFLCFQVRIQGPRVRTDTQLQEPQGARHQEDGGRKEGKLYIYKDKPSMILSLFLGQDQETPFLFTNIKRTPCEPKQFLREKVNTVVK